MQRNFLSGLLICLIPCLLAALFAVRPEKYRLGIDLAGGTILVYQINLERTQIRKQIERGDRPQAATATSPVAGLDSEQMAALAAQIKRRIDPTDIKNVTVRPSGDRRVEIILPFSGATAGGKVNQTAEDVQEVKRLISQMGVLEFRIVANGPDDEKGMQAARQAIEDAAKTKNRRWVDPRKPGSPEEDATELQFNAVRGLPPPAPEGKFDVDINDTKAKVSYAWVELGAEYREEHGLSNASENSTGTLWSRLAVNRDRTVAVPSDDILTSSAIYYSRECVSADQIAKEKADLEKLRRDNPGKSDAELEPLMNRKKYEYFVLTRVSESDNLKVGGEITMTASVGNDRTYNLAVDFRFNGAGGQQFGKITRRNKPTGSHQRQLAITLDERIVSAPSLHGEITNSGQITGGAKGFERKTVERLVQILRSGALSAELVEKPVSENTIGPTLGADTIQRGTLAIGMAFVAVLAFMVGYYRFAGLVACVALFANLLLTIGFMVAVNAAFTLPGLAGLVLTLGMAVDANVLIYERLREERNRGANLATAIRNGYDRAFFTIIDTHLTSIFTAIVLYSAGNDQLKGFAISLTVGLVISLFTSLYMTRLMFDFWLHRKWLTELKMMRLFEKPNFNPMRFRWFFFPFTGALTVVGLALFMSRGDAALNVDFRGGTVFAAKLKPGEERGLIATPDGKPGFRELLGEAAQKEKLAVKPIEVNSKGEVGGGVFWQNEPADPNTPVNVWDYVITYTDGSTTTVTLTEQPAGTNNRERAEDVRRRAGTLPDWSVEQMFLSGEQYDYGKSQRFTVRTTEKQRALVQATLDRLLRDQDGKSLLGGATMTVATREIEADRDGKRQKLTVPVVDAENKVLLSFDQPTSAAYTAELFLREFKKQNRGIDTRAFAVTGVGEPVDGRYTKLRLDVSPLTGGGEALSGLKAPEGSPERAGALVALAEVTAGAKQAFDTTPEPERLEVFDSQLAKETRGRALIAITLSWLAILLYLWFRFGNWTFGLAAVICLVHDLCFTLGAIAACHYLHLVPGLEFLGIQDFKIDLAAVAALLTLVGYSVNEIIVNFARIREVRGKNPQLTPQMINDSVNQTLSRTILTSMTVFLVSIVLYAFGGEGVHLFAFVMVVGVLISTYSSIFVASPLLLFLGEGNDTAGAAADAPASDDSPEAAAATGEEAVVEG
jgi:SecD/SecF fusion protein